MQYEWPKKIKNLETLTNNLIEFFKRKNFDVRTAQPRDKSETTRILAVPTAKTEIRETIKIEVSETPNGTAVNFVATDRAEESIKIGTLSRIIVGGALLMKGVNTKEKLDALETEFWAHTQEFIAGLSD